MNLFETTSPFHAGGPSHGYVMLAMLATVLICSVLARKKTELQQPIGKGLSLLLMLSLLINVWVEHRMGVLDRETIFPLHVCDMAVFFAFGAFWFRSLLCYEMLYFWGLTGTVQALLTPDLAYDFPHPKFVTFFINHAGIIATIGYAIGGMKWLPSPGARNKVFRISVVYTVFLLIFNACMGTNFGYLSHKPASASVLDFFGPWPGYVLVMLAMIWIFFWINELPARWLRSRWEKSQNEI